MIKLTEEIINSTNGLSSGTYVVEDTIMLSHNLTIPKDVTFIFQGGKFNVADGCTEEITISGTNTRLVAPICTIFGKGINVIGTWDIDRAYPQWFEIENVINSCDSLEPYYDWSTPINKAIKMKQVGEVFLKNGDYSIASPIIMNCQIQLVGENSQYKDVKDALNSENKIERKIVDGGSSRIFPVAEGESAYSDEYMLYVNVEAETKSTFPGMEYIARSTLIKNICFTNWGEKTIISQKCILAGGGVHLDNLVWWNFLQAVKYTDTYNDGRCIRNCVFSTDPQMCEEADKDVYAFDTGFLGDGMVFELNGIAVTANGKALRLSNCGGASIQGNVINGDILIKSSKAVVFNANHCENGMQIEIVDSCVTTNNNYIWKGSKPSYLICGSGSGDKSVVSLNNDMLIVINDILDKNNSDENSDNSVDNNENSDNNSSNLDENNNNSGENSDNSDENKLKDQMNSLAEYDISLDKDTILNIENVFRYDVGTYGFGKMYPFGIRLCTNNKNSSDGETNETPGLEEFNKYSYLSSCKSSILSGFEVRMQGTIKQVNTPNVYCMMSNEGVFWLGDEGSYRYYYQIIWDKDRNIKKTSSSTSTSNTVYNINRYSYDNDNDKNLICYNYIDIKKVQNEKGVLLVMDEDTNGNCSMVRLIREKVFKNEDDNIIQFVDVPVCGSQFLYDNGISVCGYKWSSIESTDDNKPSINVVLNEISDKNMEMLRIIDGNVECYTKREDGITPTSGWKRGDVIHNISISNPSTYIVPDDIA